MMRTSLGRDFDLDGEGGDEDEAGRLAAAAFFRDMRQA
jgi:hypothetical protein